MRKLSGISLQRKIIAGYLILLAVIGSMIAILLHERKKMHDIADGTAEIREIRNEVNAIRRHIVGIALLGESAIGWDSEDFSAYRNRRLHIDSLLERMKDNGLDLVSHEQIDTLRRLLEEKESRLYHLTTVFQEQRTSDSLLYNRLPEVINKSTRTRTVTRRKNGIAGFFGKKETVQVPASTTELRQLNRQLMTMQEEHDRHIGLYVDSLRLQNLKLNKRLNSFITALDEQVQAAFQNRETRIAEAKALSFKLFAATIIVAIVLLIISHLVIQRDIRRKEHDRSRLVDALKQNRELSEMRKRIIVTLSHDIRGPLNAICGSAELAIDTRERKRRNTYLDNIIKSSRHITRLANSLLDLSRLDEAKESLNRIPFSLKAFVDDINVEYTCAANDKGLVFKTEAEDTDIVVCGDADRIRQVADNLLTNALKFTRNGTVCFRISHKDGVMTMEVEDSGIGMDTETVERIFRPFERAAPDISPEGFGLGLPITKGLLNLLGGSISVSSHVGKGSLFHTEIPLAISTEPVKNSVMPAVKRYSLPKRIILADDDPIQLRIVMEMLERNGVSCRTCIGAKDVAGELRKEPYDLLLTDIQMHGTSGFDLLYLLRHSNIGNSRTIPVAAMTARNDVDESRYTEAGFSGCIRKPFSMNELLAFLSSIMERSGQQQEQKADFNALAADTGDMEWMLNTFIKESLDNRTELKEALESMKTDTERMKNTLHRMYPTWEQLGVACELETYNRILHDDTSDDLTISTYTEAVIGRIDRLVGDAKNLLSEIRRLDLKNYTDETQNTHS
ncbi:ATP-binding response regulator [Phocaeicola plebeius]|uniref:ATP-binding response regulator n=1 Tax=Phocaeicola plebeius TaxID=310297 RepID=UPI00307D9878